MSYLDEVFSLKGKVAFVTGASYGGLGFHHSIALAGAGADVVLADLPERQKDLEKTSEEVERLGRRFLMVDLDVTNEQSIKVALEKATSYFEKVDILVNNAGIARHATSVEMSISDWKSVIDVNLTGVWLCSRTFARDMIRRGVKGKIINISSIAGHIAIPAIPDPPYYAAKAGVINLTRYLAVEWAKYGITVNAIGPGFFPSRLSRASAGKPMDDDKESYVISRIPLNRIGDPKELAGVLILLASSASDYITGQTIFVDGGWTAQ